jgi:predicted metalloprotease
MRWKGRRRSSNVEDRRRLTPRRAAMGGGIGVVIVAVVVMLLGGNPGDIIGSLGGGGGGRTGSGSPGAAEIDNRPISPWEEELAEFVSVVLADTEEVWTEVFRREGRTYRKPKLVLYRDQVQTAGGMASAAMGPFYLSTDETIYIDLSFFEDLKRRFQAPGDFAQAYVIAHEVGHHVQNLLGILDRVHAARQRLSEREYNKLSVRLELQADYYSGVWANHADRKWRILEPGDVEEALGAASAIGDDRIQKQTSGRVVPDSFTHGTSAQRVAWFRHGVEKGTLADGDTFDDVIFRRVDPVGR